MTKMAYRSRAGIALAVLALALPSGVSAVNAGRPAPRLANPAHTAGQLVNRFFAGQMSADERRVLFDTNHIRYVIVEPGLSIPNAPELSLLYNQDGYMVYEETRR